jgi:uncharacterized RDD family membrane protein YckC
MAIVSCENCGVEIPEGTSFCARCGSPVSVSQLGPVYVPQNASPPAEIQAPAPAAVRQTTAFYAGFWRRAAAFVIDAFILSIIFALAASFYPSQMMVLPDPNAQSMFVIPQIKLPGLIFLFVMMWVYYASFEASAWQGTPGKRLLRLYVTDLNGRPISLGRASLRYFGRRISEFTFLVGFIMAGFTARKQALHDLLSGCLVLRRP